MSNIIDEATIVRQYAPIEGTKETEGRGHAERTHHTTGEDADHKPFKEKVKGLFHRDKGDKLERTHFTAGTKPVVICNDPNCTAPRSTTLQVACTDPACTGPRAVGRVQETTHVEKNQSHAGAFEPETDRKPLKEHVKELFHRDKEEKAEGHQEKEHTKAHDTKAHDKDRSKHDEISEEPTMKDKIAATVHNVKDKVHPYKKDGEKGASSHHHTAADEAAVRHHLAEHPGAGAKIGAKLKQEAAEATKEHIKHKLRVKLGKEKDTTDKQEKHPAEKHKKAKEHRRSASNEAPARKERDTAVHHADSETTMVAKEGHLPAAQVRAVQQAEPAIQTAINTIQQSTGQTPSVNVIVMPEPAKSNAMDAVKEAAMKAKDLTVEGTYKVLDAALVAKDKVEAKIAEHKANSADKDAEGGGLAGVKEKALDGVHKVTEAAAPVAIKIKDSALLAKDKMSELIAAHKADELEPEPSKAPPDTVLVSETTTRTVYEAGDGESMRDTEGRGAHNPCTVVTAKALEIVHTAKEAVVAGVSKIPVVGPKLVKHDGDAAIEDGQQDVLVRDVPLEYTMRGELPEVKPTDNKDELFDDNPSLSMKDKVQHAKDVIVGGVTKAAAAIPVVGPKLVKEHAEPDALVRQDREPDAFTKPSEIVREEVPLLEQEVFVEHKNPPELVPATDLDAQRAMPILPSQGSLAEGGTILVAPLGPGGFKEAVIQTDDEVRIRTAEDEIVLRKDVVMGKQPVEYTLHKEVANLNRLDDLDRPTFKEKLHDARKDEQRY